MSIGSDRHRHGRFAWAFAIGVAVAAGAAVPLGPAGALLAGTDAFFVAYLALMLHFARITGPEDLRRRAAQADEGMVLILALSALAVGVSLSAIAWVLNRGQAATGAEVALSLAAVPLGWAMVQVLASFHYAHRYYTPQGGGDRGGLAFPGGGEPGPWDFLYFGFGIGMTAQVADVAVTDTGARRAVLAQSLAAFGYNTVVVALAVNAVAVLAG